MLSATTSRYHGRRASLTTMHAKLPLVAPSMQDILGLEVFDVVADTDSLGTFSGEQCRRDTPFNTAVKKARMGMDLSGSRIGFASEGSIGNDNLLPIAVDHELLVFVDDEEGFILAESSSSYEIRVGRWDVADDIPTFDELTKAGFPDHGMIVRGHDRTTDIHKGIHTMEGLEQAFRDCKSSGAHMVIVESDLRAHHSPSRRAVIQAASHKLAERLLQTCPECDCPGWGVVNVLRGRPCAMCTQPTQVKSASVMGCARCDHREIAQQIDEPVDPSCCDFCNP